MYLDARAVPRASGTIGHACATQREVAFRSPCSMSSKAAVTDRSSPRFAELVVDEPTGRVL
jgi:hypothetical protein